MILKQIPEDFIVEEVLDLKIKKNGEYCYFLLTKKQWNTVDAINKISSIINKKIHFAGIKDKQAITTQYIAIKNCNPKQIENLKIKDIELKYLGRGDKEIFPDLIKCNKFMITVRNLDKPLKKIKQIPNYFDEQRFGKDNLNRIIGKHLIKKEFKQACEKLKIETNEPISELRKKIFLTKFYLQSYQSYLFNEVLKQYIKTKTKDYAKFNTKLGEFILPLNKIKNIEIPLINFDTEFKDKTIEKIYEDLLEKENIKKQDFIIRQMPKLISTTVFRKAFIEITELNLDELKEDELNPGKKKQTVQFILPKGAYATMAIKIMNH